MHKVKKWIVMSLMTAIILTITLANASHPVYAQSNQATLVVVGDTQKGIILCPKVENLDPNESAFDMLQKEFGDKITTASFGGKPYVTGIDGLKEGDRGSMSGWLYEINGKSAEVGAGDYIVQNGDVIAFRYSLDWGNDLQKQTLEDSLKALGGCSTSVNSGNQSNQQGSNQTPNPVQLPTADEALNKATQFALQNGIQSDWQAIALTRATASISNDQKKNYLQQLEDRVQTSGRMQGTLLARTILAVNAVGGDPTNIAGQNLIAKMYNDKSLSDIYSYSYALIALDSKDYQIPDNALWKRGNLISTILEAQTAAGNWADDPDTNAMVLMALAPHRDIPQVETAIQKAMNYLQSIQLQSGGFESFGIENSNSSAVVVTALSMLGVNPTGDAFTKNSNVVDSLISYQLPDGGFKWKSTDEQNDALAFDQAFDALVQYKYFLDGKGSIFHWTDTVTTGNNEQSANNANGTPGNSSVDQTKPALEQQAQMDRQQAEIQNSAQSESNKAPEAKQPKQKLPNTGLLGNAFWSSVTIGLLFIVAATIAFRKKFM